MATLNQAALSLNDEIFRNESLVTSEMDDDLVMLSIENGKYYGLNAMGKRIWKILTKPTPVSAVCAQLASEYNVSPQQCEAEVLTFLQQLTEQKLVMRCG
jgi:hypothetical protein